jgi:glycogen(starch) synthase
MIPTVSVVINTYNRARTLPATLAAMAWQRHPRFEVIVVNGPSTDETEDVLARHAGCIRTARCPDANLSMSRNIGMAMAAGDIVAYTDDDAVPEPDWLDALCSPYADPEVGAVGGFIRDHTGFAWQCRVVACDRYGDNEGFVDLVHAQQAGVASRGPGAQRYLSPTGANCSFRRKALLGIGGFDEGYAYFLDETDVAVRLIDAGWTVTYAPRAEVHHKYADSHLRDASRIPRSILQPARSKAYFCVRHALPQVGLPKVIDYLATYRRDRRRDKDWLLENGLIDAPHHARLIEEIGRGTELGVTDGLRCPDGRMFAGLPATDPLLPFPVSRQPRDRLRLCFISQDYPPGPVGGIAIWTHTMATALAARGHEVSVVTRTEGLHRVDFEQGVWVHRIPLRHHAGREVPLMPDLPGLAADWALTAHDEVLRIRARRGLELVSAPIWDVEGAACLADGTLPVVTSLHSTYRLVLPSKRKWQEDAVYRRFHVDKLIAAEGWMLDRSRMILANSAAILCDIEAAYGLALDTARVRLVPHGLPHEAPATPPQRDPGCRILFVGRFETRKGIDILAAAIPRVLDMQPDARFVLAGDPDVDEDGRGPTHRAGVEALVARYPGRVEMTGLLPRDALVEQYARADIFVAPSRYESFGLIFLEAMMHGAACVGTRAGGIPEVVEDGTTGLLVPPEDPAALAEALARLVGDAPLRRRMGEAGLAAYRQKFTAERMAEMAEAPYRAAAWEAMPPHGRSVMPDGTASVLQPSTAAGRAA